MAGSGEKSMSRDIFRKVPLSEKKALFKEGVRSGMHFLSKGDGEELVNLVLSDYVEGKVLVFRYAAGSPEFSNPQTVVFNFSYGFDRYFFHAPVEVFPGKVHVSAQVDVFVLQRRKSPRLELPLDFPAGLNIIQYQGRPCLYECKLMDFSSGGCRALYPNHLPLFKSGEKFKAVIHLSHRRPFELECEIKHHAIDSGRGEQTFGIQFVLTSTIMENKMLVTFLELQRELFVKWGQSLT